MRFTKFDIVWALGGAAVVYVALLFFGLVPAIPAKYLPAISEKIFDSISLAVTAIAIQQFGVFHCHSNSGSDQSHD